MVTRIQTPSPFANAQIDFSRIGQLADSYYGAQNDALKRQAFQTEQAEKAAERQRQEQMRGVLAGGIPMGPDGTPDYYKLADNFARLGGIDESTKFLGAGEQSRERADNRAHRDRSFEADQSYRNAQLGIQREQLTPSDVREYKFYADQERAAGREPMSWTDYRRQVASSSYGKSGQIVQGSDGQFYSVQFGSDGSRKIEPLAIGGQGAAGAPGVPQAPSAAPQQFPQTPPQTPQAQPQAPVSLTPSRGVKEVDTGRGTQIIDAATGLPVREVSKDIAGAEAEKVRGKNQAEGEAALPKARNALADYEIKNEFVLSSIDKALSQAGPWTTGFVGNLSSWVAGTPAHDLSKTLMGIQSNLGFESLQTMRDNSPTGGALGSVTERELELLQSTWGSLVQSQSQEQFVENLNKLKAIKQQFAIAKREAYERDAARFGAANVPNPDGGGQSQAAGPIRARNPQTGQTIEWDGQQWVPVQ